MSLSEFDIIQQYFNQNRSESSDIVKGIGDDAAILRIPDGQELLISMDTLVEKHHFPLSITAENLGHRALAVNLSDMAAMGAEPKWFTLGLTIPEANREWLEGFSRGLFNLANTHHLHLIGGDITRGALTITIQIHGFAATGTALQRSGARPGDLIYVTGELGGGGIAYSCLNGRLRLSGNAIDNLLERYYRPVPRIEAGTELRGIASSAIDISDGLLADLGHILDASKVGATIMPEQIPLCDVAGQLDRYQVLDHALRSGDDYELCFTVAPEHCEQLEQQLRSICRISCIGEINDQVGLINTQKDGIRDVIEREGFMHFGGHSLSRVLL